MEARISRTAVTDPLDGSTAELPPNRRGLGSILCRLAPYVTVLLVLVAVLSPLLFSDEWIRTHEKYRYLILFRHFEASFVAGNLYPRWMPELYGGHGYPFFVFYQPAFFFLVLPFSLAFGPVAMAFKLAIFSAFCIGSVGIYRLAHELDHRRIALPAALLFITTPYLFVNLYVRGDLTELLSMALCPWPLVFFVRLRNRIRAGGHSGGAMMGLAVALALLCYSHPTTALFYVPVFSVIAAYVTLMSSGTGNTRRSLACAAGLSLLMGLVLSSPYWLTVFRFASQVNLEAARTGYFAVGDHFVSWPQFFSREWGYGGSLRGVEDGMSFALGFPHFAAALVGFAFARKKPIVQISLIAYLLCIGLMTGAASWLWENVALLEMAQFPWRLLSITATLQILCALGIDRLPFRRALWKPLSFFGLVLFAGAWQWAAFVPRYGETADVDVEVNRLWEGRLHAIHTYAARNEYSPKTAVAPRSLKPLGERALLTLSGPGEVVPQPDHTPYRLHYRVLGERSTWATVSQFYFSGWRVVIDSVDVPDAELRRNMTRAGLIRFRLEPGQHTILAYYDGPPGWRLQTAGVIASFLGFAALCFRQPGKERSQAISRSAEL
jgi:hypothetical protein